MDIQTQIANFEGLTARLASSELDLAARITIAQEIRELIEIVQSAQNPRLLSGLVAAASEVLTKVPPAFSEEAPEQKLRNTVLEIIQRLPYNEAMKTYSSHILRLVMIVLQSDNEENAAICLRIIIELHKNFRNVPQLEEYVQPFFDFFKKMLQFMQQNVREFIDEASEDMILREANPGSLDSGESGGRAVLKSVNSFKVLSECPIILVLLFQIYKKFIAINIPELVPLIIQVIQIRAEAQKEFGNHEKEGFVAGPNPDITNKTLYAEFIGAQVKIMSFLAYIIRGFSNLLKPHQQIIADSIVSLLIDCPHEASSTRKELLVAARHILSTDFRVSFIPYIDLLFREDVLIGPGMTSRETLRPLGYSMLADLVHHIRQELSSEQIMLTISLYTKNLHDPSLAPSIQTMCSKLLLNVIDCVVANPNKDEAKRLLLRILEAFTSKFAFLRSILEKLQSRSKDEDGTQEEDLCTRNELKCALDIEYVAPLKTSIVSSDHQSLEIVKDYKFLFKTLVLGLKTIVYGLKTVTTVTTPPGAVPIYKKLSEEEIGLFLNLYRDGLMCFGIFQMSGENKADQKTPYPSSRLPAVAKEEKEVLEHFVTVFTLVDPAIFHEIFQEEMQFFFERLTDDPAMLAIPQYLLASEGVSRNFSSILLKFLMNNLEDLGQAEASKATLILRLFKLVFMAVTLYPEANETVLQPYIYDLIMKALKYSATAKEPNTYFLLLRALFRNIGGGRFELLYKEVLPLLPFLLKSLNSLLNVAEKAHMRDLFVELCLTVPVRLSVLLPHLHYLMQPLVFSLEAGPELVSQGLRTLELCIDNLTAEFLDPILAPVFNQLMVALWKHLKPAPYNQAHSHATLRILGKLGGRNRKMLKDSSKLQFKDIHSSFKVAVVFEPGKPPIQLCLEECLNSAERTFLDSNSASEMTIVQSFDFLSACISLFIDPAYDMTILEHISRISQSKISVKDKAKFQKSTTSLSSEVSVSLGENSNLADVKESSASALTKILVLLMNACNLEKVSSDAYELCNNLAVHFALIHALECSNFDADISKMILPSDVFYDAIYLAFTGNTQSTRKTAEDMLHRFKEVLFDIQPSMKPFDYLCRKFSAACYKPEWYKKIGGSQGLHILLSRLSLGKNWAREHQTEYVKALIYTLKDMSSDLAVNGIQDVQNILMYILRYCNEIDQSEKVDMKALTGPLLTIFMTELSNPNETVRKTVHKALSLISEIFSASVTDVLFPYKDRLLFPIFSKPLRALPFSMQIGNLDALTYCLLLDKPLIEFNEELLRMIKESRALADADDTALTSRSSQLKNAELLISLRTACLRFLSVAQSFADMATNSDLMALRKEIAHLFFKCMYSKSSQIVDAAKQGLKQAVIQQKIPKELLQTGLRPILLNLSEYKKLSTEGLTGLARLLELLTSYFKVEIGQKLLDHLNKWAAPPALENAAVKPSSESNEVNIICGILDVIHLLPPGAVTFMNDMVKTVISLENGIRKSYTSPFRLPLMKFLNKFPKESVQYFLSHLGDLNYVRLFAHIITKDDVKELRKDLIENMETLVNTGFNMESSSPLTRISSIFIIHELVKSEPESVLNNNALLNTLIVEWEVDSSSLIPSDPFNDIMVLYHKKRVAELLINFINHKKPKNSDLIFRLLGVFDQRTIINYNFIKEFIVTLLLEGKYEEIGKQMLFKSLDVLNNSDENSSRKITVVRTIIIPALIVYFDDIENNSKFLKELLPWVQKFISQVLAIQESNSSLKVEYLQIISLLVSKASSIVEESRKDIVKYNWGFLKSEDTIIRQSAYVVLALFIQKYDTPPKIVIQVFVSLLRSYQSEARVLVRHALNTLCPSLPERLPEDEKVSPLPPWVRWTRKILIDDGHLIPQLIVVWQMIIRHENLFYPYREYFIQLIVGSLGKLGMTPSSTTDTKSLTIDLAELIYKWECRRIENVKQTSEDKMEVDEVMEETGKKRKMESFLSESRKKSKDLYIPNTNIRDVVINYLVRFLCMNNEPLQKRGKTYKALALVKQYMELEIWKECSVKMAFIEKFVTSTEISESTIGQIITVVKSIYFVSENRSPSWFIDNLSYFQTSFEKYIPFDDPKLVEPTSETVNLFFSKIGSDTVLLSSAASLVNSLQTLIMESLSNGRNLYSIVSVLKGIATSLTSLVDQTLPILSKILIKISKEFPTTASNAGTGHLQIFSMIVSKILFLMNERLANLGESKKNFFTAVALLIDKCSDMAIQKTILDTVNGWIFSEKSSILTPKEKAGFLLKYSTLETRVPSDLFERYLKIILRIYKDDSLIRSELTVRLEPVFLIGCRSMSVELREEFIHIFDKNLPVNLFARLSYIIGVQNWEYLASSYWIRQCDEILIGMVKTDSSINRRICGNITLLPLSACLDIKTKNASPSTENVSEVLRISHTKFLEKIKSTKISAFIKAFRFFLHLNVNLAASLFKETFIASWKMMTVKERHDLNKYYVALLAKEHHLRQIDMRPNVISCLLDTATCCDPPLLLPPQIVRYTGKTFNCWHNSMEILQKMLTETDSSLYKDYSKVQDVIQDSILDLFAELAEEDAFIGLWRRRCLYPETNAALSFEQVGMWQEAQSLYESAQIKARNGLLPFMEAEYCLWEDRWIQCTQKLQQWDLCNDLAKYDNNIPLQLECAWRITDWNSERETLQHSVSLVADNPSPRQKVFEAFLILSQLQEHSEKLADLQKTCDEGIQLALRKWHSLPDYVGLSHIPLLHAFQQFVELQEASARYGSQSNAANRMQSIQELKGTLGTWRDRLPNFWEDINVWSQLIAWRQHVFSVINLNYQNVTEQGQGAVSTLAYRGFHEIAWIINRFAHVARKHHLFEVCNNSLSKIYTLPNIEIQDAFLKLREQAKCHLDLSDNSDLISGLEVINTTNLGYFQSVQRAEFFAFKGIFLGKLNMATEAHQAFSAALQIDANLPKGWSAWARFNDYQFQTVKDISFAADAVNAYMQAAGLYKNYRSRKYLARVLWLLGCDDQEGKISKAFELYRGEISTWYWISFIPQLLNSLGSDTRHYKSILIRIAKAYPQALYLPLRTVREDFRPLRLQAIEEGLVAASPATPSGNSFADASNEDKKDDPMDEDKPEVLEKSEEESSQPPFVKKKPWEHVEEIMTIVKTAYPLLALSIETMTDQMLTQLKPTADEDVYRIIMAIMSDGYQHISRNLSKKAMIQDDSVVIDTMKSTIERFINSPLIAPSKYHSALEKDFLRTPMTIEDLVEKCREWRDKLDLILDSRQKVNSLEVFSRYLVEFEHQKFDEVEVPGQYLLLRDNHNDFVKIDRFVPELEFVKGHGIWYRRIVFIGHDGTRHCFSLQIPSARHSRREERVMQLFRQWNSVLERRVETRQRGIVFRMPLVISLAPTARLVQDDHSSISLHQIYEKHCLSKNIDPDAPIRKYIEWMRSPEHTESNEKKFKLEVFDEISSTMLPDSILSSYMQQTFSSFSDLWLGRQRFISEYACISLVTFVMNIGHRSPQKFTYSRSSGKMYCFDLLPLMNSNLILSNPEPIPFRLTQNIQKFMNVIGLEGQFVGTLINLAGALAQRESAIDPMLDLIIRDEVLAWKQMSQNHNSMTDSEFIECIKNNCDLVKKRIIELSCKEERKRTHETTLPVCQPILELISQSTNPQCLAEMEPMWLPWF